MRKDNTNNILVAMSGGVDSSATALILKEAGYHVKGAILRMHDAQMSPEDISNGKLPQAIWYAREVSRKLRLDFNIIDVRKEFEDSVVNYFVDSYARGVTPNPCVYCNRNLKIPYMLKAADDLECGRIATGHYAVIAYNDELGRYTLRKSKDPGKDQSYMLYQLTQEQLARILTPLGNYEKQEIRQIARDAGLKNAQAPDSQDICFIPDKDYAAFVEKKLLESRTMPKPLDMYSGKAEITGADPANGLPALMPGDFVDEDGNVLGQHKGLIHYTIGQRKGLGLSLPESLYVSGKNLAANQVVLARDEQLYQKKVRAGHVNFVSLPALPEGQMRISAKIRYSQVEAAGTARMLQDGTLEVEFDDAVRAPAPGQSMVLYDGDLVVAGGIIMA